MDDSRKKGLRRLLIAVAIIGLLVASAMTVSDGVEKNRELPAQGVPAIDAPAQAQEPAPAPTQTNPEPPQQDEESHQESKYSREDAVDAAVTAFEAISRAHFLPLEQRRETVRRLAVPEVRRNMVRRLGADGKDLAQKLGYGDDLQDLLSNGYKTTVEQVHVDSFGDGRATISVYSLTQVVGKQIVKDLYGQDVVKLDHYWPRSITVVKMRWRDSQRQPGRWLFVKRQDPAPGRAPVFKKGEALDQEEHTARFQRFIKEYEPYVRTR